MRETQVQSLGQEDPLEKGWLPTSVFWPGEFHGQRSLADYSPWGCKELDMPERLSPVGLSFVVGANMRAETGGQIKVNGAGISPEDQ